MHATLTAIWDFLHQPGNLDIVKMFGGFIAAICGAGVFLWDRLQKKHEQQKAAIPPVPASQRPYNRSPRPLNRTFSAVIVPYVAVSIIAVGISYGVFSYVNRQNPEPPTITVSFKVCRGEIENLCGAHDVFVGCGDPNAWAKQACIKFGAQALSTRGGNQCGYTVWNYTCVQKLPQ